MISGERIGLWASCCGPLVVLINNNNQGDNLKTQPRRKTWNEIKETFNIRS